METTENTHSTTHNISNRNNTQKFQTTPTPTTNKHKHTYRNTKGNNIKNLQHSQNFPKQLQLEEEATRLGSLPSDCEKQPEINRRERKEINNNNNNNNFVL